MPRGPLAEQFVGEALHPRAGQSRDASDRPDAQTLQQHPLDQLPLLVADRPAAGVEHELPPTVAAQVVLRTAASGAVEQHDCTAAARTGRTLVVGGDLVHGLRL